MYTTIRRQVRSIAGNGERAVHLERSTAVVGKIIHFRGDKTNPLVVAGQNSLTGEACKTITLAISPARIHRATGTGKFQLLIEKAAEAGEGKVVEFVGRSLAPRARRGQRFGTGSFGLEASEAYLWNPEKNEKTDLETGDVIAIPAEVVAQELGKLGL